MCDWPALYSATEGRERYIIPYQDLLRFARDVHVKYDHLPHKDVWPELSYKAHFLAWSVLEMVLGTPWIETHLLAREAPGKGGFLKRSLRGDFDHLDHFTRTTLLGEMFFNLQLVDGLEGVLDLLRAGDIEAAMAELEVGTILTMAGCRFKYVRPSQVKGQKTHDVEMLHPNGQTCFVEVKARNEDKELSFKAAARKLKRAAGQLPEGRPGVVFLKVPPAWRAAEAFVKKVEEMTNEIFRSSTRVAMIHVFMARAVSERGEYLQNFLGKEFINPNHAFIRTLDWHIAKRPIGATRDWAKFLTVIADTK